jgi:hypothetical protein
MSWQDSGISSEGCKVYNNGRRCKLELKGCCPRVHDPNLRSEALKKKKKLAASRAKLQQQYTLNQAASNPSTEQKNTLPQQKVCQYFIRGGCKKENCKFLHDQSARRTPVEERKKAGTANQQNASKPKEGSKGDSASLPTPSGQVPSDPLSKVVALTQAIKQLVKVDDSKIEGKVTNPEKKSKQGNQQPQDNDTKQKPRTKRGPKKINVNKDTALTVPKPVTESASDSHISHQPIWTEEVGDGWGRSKAIKAGAINSATHFPPLSGKTDNFPPPKSYVPGWTKSKLDLSPISSSQKQVVVVGRDWNSKRTASKPSGPTATVAATTTALQVLSPNPSTTAVATVAIRPAVKMVKLTSQGWDDHGEQSWALTNLRKTTIKKIEAQIEKGAIPLSFFQTIPEMAPPGTSFPFFRLLPAELRIQIWGYVLDGERYEARIKINYEYEYEFDRCSRCKFISQNCVPRLLHVNHEARHLALQQFEVTFGTMTNRSETYFNYKKDRLFIHTRGPGELPLIVNSMIKFDRKRIERLSLPLRDFVTNRNQEVFAKAVSKFSGLKRFWLVVGDGREDANWGEGKNPERWACHIHKFIAPYWRKENGTPMPYVSVLVIEALKAHMYKIDGLCWS